MQNQSSDFLDRKTVIARFNKAALSYEKASILQREIADRLLDRLSLLGIQPQLILDIGARSGYTSQLWSDYYPQAYVIAVDWAEKMLMEGSAGISKICAEPEKIPLPDQSADLIIANLVWHWVNDPMLCLREWRRLLKPGGVLLLTTVGPDTLQELRASFAAVDEFPHVHLFLDMHDIGDALMLAKFSEPVMQAERLVLTYRQMEDLMLDLRGAGVGNALHSRRRGLYGKQRWGKMLNHYKNFYDKEAGFPATIEIIYGLAWSNDSSLNFQDEDGNVRIPLSTLKYSRRRGGND